MAKISFSKSEAAKPVIDIQSQQVPTPVPGVTVESVTGACCVPSAPPASSVPATRADVAPPPLNFFGAEESIDFRDLDLPRFNIVQKTGDLSNIYPPGTMLLDQKLVLPPPVEIIVLMFRPTQYAERVPGGGLGNLCDTEAEVVECGGSTVFNEARDKNIPWYQPLATAMILIKQPAGVESGDYFNAEFDGASYAIALWSMKGSAYTHAAKYLKTKKKIGYLKKGYHVTSHLITTELEKFKTGNTAWVPVIKRGIDTAPGFEDFVRALLCGE